MLWNRRTVAAFAMAAFLPASFAGCFGSFNMTKKVYRFNKQVDPDKWIQWFVFIIISIIPVYGFAVLVDTIIANSLEFWTGENPIMAKRVVGPDGSVMTFVPQGENVLQVQIEAPDGRVGSFEFAREGSSVVARSEDGSLIARVADVSGQPAIVE